MDNKILEATYQIILMTSSLLSCGLLAWFFLKESETTFQNILFWAGTAPVALSTVGLFGDLLGRGDSSYQMSKSVIKQSPNKRSAQDSADLQAKVFSGIKWLAAGILV